MSSARVAEGSPGALLDVRPAETGRREAIDRRGGPAVASLAELISSGEPVLAICADAGRRARLASEAADPRRFGAALPRIACCRCGSAGLDEALSEEPVAGLVLADWTSIARRPRAPLAFRHVVLVDPPPSEPLEDLAWATAAPAAIGRGPGAYIHLAWGPAEADLAERLIDWEWNLRAAIREIWRGLTATGGEASRLRAPHAARRRVGLFPDGRARGPLRAGAQRARSVRMAARLTAVRSCGSYPRRGPI